MNLKFKNIFYPLIIWLLTFIFFFFFILFIALPFTDKTILEFNNSQSWIFWLSFFFLYSLIIYLILYLDTKKNNLDSAKYFKLFFVFIFVNAILSLIPMLIFISLSGFIKGDVSNTVKISFFIFVYFILLWFILVYYFNLLISISLEKEKLLQIINHNIWFFIFNKIDFKRKENLLYEFKIRKKNLFFGCYFIDEKDQIIEIQFEDQIEISKQNQNEEKVIDFFANVVTKENQKKQIDLQKIEADALAKISSDYLKNNQSNYFIYLNNNFENLILKGKIPEKVIIMKEKNFVYQFKKVLKKIKRESGN